MQNVMKVLLAEGDWDMGRRADTKEVTLKYVAKLSLLKSVTVFWKVVS
jgi:hypothetical protein